MLDRIIGFILGLFLVVQPFLYGVDNKIAGKGDVVFASLLAVALVALAWSIFTMIHRRPKLSAAAPKRTTLTWLDLAVAAYLLYGLLNVIFVRHAQVDLLWWLQWGALAGGYALFRALPDKKMVVYALIFSGVVQSFVALGQELWWFESNHMNFRITGSFGNPGQLGGYLAVCFTIALWQAAGFFTRKKNIGAVITGVAMTMMGSGLVLADSRAGVLAALCGAGAYILYKVKLDTAKRKTIVAVSAVVAAAAICAVLFLYRPASAQARLFTWCVSADMIADKPIFGHGVGSFNDHYMLYQAKYFEEHPDTEYLAVADNVGYPYNEFLHIGIEQGIAGFVLALVLFWFAFADHSRKNGLFRAALLALIVFSMFSYPADTFPLMFLFAILLGCIGGRPLKKYGINKGGLLAVAALSAGLFIVAGRSYFRYVKLSDSLYSMYRSEERDLSKEEGLNASYAKFKDNKVLSDMYLLWLAENTNDESDLARITELTPMCGSYLAIGDALMRFGQHTQAEKHYTTASKMIPTRMTPNYQLWKLYIETEDTAKAVATAQKLISQQLKAENTLNIRKRVEVKTWLERQRRPKSLQFGE